MVTQRERRHLPLSRTKTRTVVDAARVGHSHTPAAALKIDTTHFPRFFQKNASCKSYVMILSRDLESPNQAPHLTRSLSSPTLSEVPRAKLHRVCLKSDAAPWPAVSSQDYFLTLSPLRSSLILTWFCPKFCSRNLRPTDL